LSIAHQSALDLPIVDYLLDFASILGRAVVLNTC